MSLGLYLLILPCQTLEELKQNIELCISKATAEIFIGLHEARRKL
jgi:hypothetical protein